MKALIPILTSALLLSGCVRTVETRVNTLGGAAGMVPGDYVLAPPESTLSPELLQARQFVAEHLLANGFKSSETGTFYLQVTASSRPAILAVAKTEANKPVILSAANPKRSSSKCVNSEYQVSVILTRISDGHEAYRGTAAETHCKMTFAQVMPDLAKASLGDLHLPVGIAGRQGAYVLKRKLSKAKN